jgi:6-phosphogluconate dehydrogenase
MEMGMVGLGRMGANMVRRLRRGKVRIVAYDREAAVMRALGRECRAVPAASLKQLVEKLSSKTKIVWLMVPAGGPTEQALNDLLPHLKKGDILIDGGNANYKDSMRRGQMLARRGLHFIDAGVSGGIWGLKNGYALMVGGAPAAVRRVAPLLKILAPAPNRGWLHCGPVGSGHFVKMVHNGIEYGMMQAFAEGFALMKSRKDFRLNLASIAEMWRHGSVVRSWLLDLTADFLKVDQKLDSIKPFVADSGEGRWTALEAVEQGIPAPVMSLSLMMRFATQGSNDYAAKMLAMMRKGFGGHAVKPGK